MIMGRQLDTNGNLYVALPDNTNLDVTPFICVPNAPYYTFNVTATKYIPTIQVITNGAPAITLDPQAPAQFCVGQSLQFQWAMQPSNPGDPPLAYVPPSYAYWTFSGNYVNHTNALGGSYSWDSNPMWFGLFNPAQLWYVSNGLNTVTAKIGFFLTNGQVCFLNVTDQYNIFRPTVNMYNSAVTGPPALMWHPVWTLLHGGELGVGIPEDESSSGIGTNDVAYELQVVCPYHWSGNMSADIVQLMTLSGDHVRQTNVVNWCDNGDPYPHTFDTIHQVLFYPPSTTNNLLYFEDGPCSPGRTNIIYNGSFTDYIMFNPGGPLDISVPLGNVTWGMAINQAYPNTNLSSNTLTPPSMPHTSANWPNYTNTYHN